jgi:hypothetical protein
VTTKHEEYFRQKPIETNSAIPVSEVRGSVTDPVVRDLAVSPVLGQKRMLSVAEFCHQYGIGKTMAYAEMSAGRLPSVKRGGRRLIPVDGAEAWTKPTPDDQFSTPGAVQ